MGRDDVWIQTYTGRQFWPLAPLPEDVFIEDIAHALANLCRFGGHTREFYSVAQHSVLAAAIVPELDALWGLLHDASEAYLCDVPRPIKRAMHFYLHAEAKVMQCVAARFGLDGEMPDTVHEADMVLLATEKRDLLVPIPNRWHGVDNIAPMMARIEPWTPAKAEAEFLACYRRLEAEIAFCQC